MSDELLIGAMKAINHSDIRVPEDISILSISNGFIPGLFKPVITYIETSGYELGKLAIKECWNFWKKKQRQDQLSCRQDSYWEHHYKTEIFRFNSGQAVVSFGPELLFQRI